jgi:hypothetical protein
MFSIVSRTSFIAWQFAPSTARPMGPPCPSVRRLLLVPCLPRSVGCLPVSAPPSGAVVMAPSILNHSQSIPFHASKRSTSTCQRFKNTPAFTHAWKRSWAVEPNRSHLGLSTGSRCARRRKWRRRTLGLTAADDLHPVGGYADAPEAGVEAPPTVHRKCESR